jgi:hypothetical protein
MSARQRFLDAVRSPPTDVVAVRQRLLSRAERLAETVPRAAVPPAVDVVVAGSGFLSVYYLGVHSVLSRLTDCKRFAGASSGAQAPFQLLLAGEAATLDSYLCHGLLFGRQWLGPAMFSADQNWKALSAELVSRHAHELPKLDGRCVVSVTRWTRGGPRNVLYTEWSGQQQLATEAFYATGTALTRCGGYWCSDGGCACEPQLERAHRRRSRDSMCVWSSALAAVVDGAAQDDQQRARVRRCARASAARCAPDALRPAHAHGGGVHARAVRRGF